jgi:hypothetical protein
MFLSPGKEPWRLPEQLIAASQRTASRALNVQGGLQGRPVFVDAEQQMQCESRVQITARLRS